MKRLVVAALAALALLAVTANPGEAWYRWSSGVYIGGGPWWYWPGPYYGWGWGYPYYGYYGGPYGYPSTVVVEPHEYIEQQPAPAPPPPPAAPPAYWYYCASAGGYYPTVPTCPEDWVKVPPRDR